MITKKIVFVLVVGLLLIDFVIYFINQIEKNYTDRVYPNIYINNVNIGGKKRKELIISANKKNRGLRDIVVSIIYHNQPIATYSGRTIDLQTNMEAVINKAYLIGRSSSITANFYQIIKNYFGLSKYFFFSRISYNKAPLIEFINLSEEQYNKPARNALFKFEQGKVISFREEEYGLKILSEEFFIDLENQVQKNLISSENISLDLHDKIIKPEVTLAQANQYGIEEEIGVGKSNYSHSIPERIHNIILATSKFEGILIQKNKEFSFNEIIGDISSITGYKPAYIIKNGKTVLGDGGGVCQVSTTIFRAALNSGLPITERNAHAYRVSYYENDSKPGFDATVFNPSADLRFINDTPTAILIQSEIAEENNLLYFRFYGKKDGRRVEISSISLYDQQAPPAPIYQDDPTLKRGVVKQIDFPAWGAKASFNYKVNRDNQTIIDKTFFSSYRPWQAIYLVGTAN